MVKFQFPKRFSCMHVANKYYDSNLKSLVMLKDKNGDNAKDLLKVLLDAIESR